MNTYEVTYEIRTGITEEVVHRSCVSIVADSEEQADTLAVEYIYANDPYADDRIDPKVFIVDVFEIDYIDA